jgi:hypothetical protein
MPPDLAAQIRLAAFDILPAEFETGLGIPVRDKGNTLHFAVHSFLLLLCFQETRDEGQARTPRKREAEGFRPCPSCLTLFG